MCIKCDNVNIYHQPSDASEGIVFNAVNSLN